MQHFVFITSMFVFLNAGSALADSTAIAHACHTTTQPEINATLTIDGQGYIWDTENVIAQVTSNNMIRQANGNTLGRIAESGDIYNTNGDVLGHIDEIGYIYDRHNRILALHDISGYLLNVDGTLIQNQRISQELAVFLFFFQ